MNAPAKRELLLAFEGDFLYQQMLDSVIITTCGKFPTGAGERKLNEMKRFLSVIILGLLLLGGQTAWAERLTMTKPVANIRSGPGTKHEILWKVGQYHPLVIVKKVGDWYYFRDFEDDNGWIHKSLVGKIPAVITKKNICNVRTGAGMNHKIAFVVDKGIPFKVLKRKGDWIHVVHSDGDKGWIHKSLVW